MMKKLFILLLVAAFVLSFAACGGGTSVAPTPEPELPADDAPSVLEVFLAENSEMIYGMADIMTGGMGAGSRVELAVGTGNELIYNFFFGSGVELDDVDEAFEEIFASMGPLFEMLADEFREELELPNMRVTLRFYDSGGSVLAAESFDSTQ